MGSEPEAIERVCLAVGGRSVPALVARPPAGTAVRRSRVVIVLHGLGVDKEVHRPELLRLANAGFIGLAIDAPRHGERADGLASELASAGTRGRHALVLSVVLAAGQEIPPLVEYCRRELAATVGLVGVSMGGFTTYASLAYETRATAIVPMLASPDFSPREPGASPLSPDLLAGSPHRHPGRVPPTALLTIVAGRDEVVPPEPARRFHAVLAGDPQRYDPGRLALAEYPESGHLMRPQDWHDAWTCAMAWFDRHL